MNEMAARPRRLFSQAGFTLVEVMVALSIAAVGLAADTASVSQMDDAATSMQQRSYANWIALNKITELRIANVVPDVSSSSGNVEYAGVEWQWRATISETGVDNLFRVDVVVSRSDTEESFRPVSGFIGEPGIPGQANIAWTSNTPAAGRDE
jgi:general secretion pathway protein I